MSKKPSVNMNIIDRAIGVFSPASALERVQSRLKIQAMADSGYIATKSSKRSMRSANFKAQDSDADDLTNLTKFHGVTRDLFRNHPIVSGAIGTMKYNIMGAGLTAQPQIDNDFLGLSEDEARVWEIKAGRYFNFWAQSQNADAEHTSNFYELQGIALTGTFVSGDIFAALPYIERKDSPFSLAVRLIEADMCSNPNGLKDTKSIAGGIENDEYGAPIRYHFSKNHPSRRTGNKWIPIDVFADNGRRNVLHIFEKHRPYQRRGISVLAPVVEPLKQLGDYTQAELTAAVVSGLFTVFIKTESGELPEGYDEDTTYQDSDDLSEINLEAGSVIGLAEGESIETANPNRPNTAFDPFVSAILRHVGAALHLPYEVLIKHFSSSYSASRGALLEAWKMFRARRVWFSDRFCQPIYEEVIKEAVMLGYLPAPGFLDDPMVMKAYCGCTWNGPGQAQLNPLQETKAAKMKVEEAFSTRTKEAAEMNGTDFNANAKTAKQETKTYKETGLIEVRDGASDQNTMTTEVNNE
ncbi:phage portal protein [Sulfurovum sp. zt1-1]|uniref:Phage portal protein n=1 Tax=Sulfurovum zhangzhouensis TaxID=3019067 RepID=A0ABT7QZ16_9BACT|nr:phage portal protein [Sulfurovum zhangzhouensis]MDM5272088.1 phage portal protein [Sulfurovum zhangzhouensis]